MTEATIESTWLSAAPLAGPAHQSNGIHLDDAHREVWVNGQQLPPPLAPAQFALLQLLARADGQLCTRAQIVSAVWPAANPAYVGGEAIDALVKRLRARLSEAAPAHEYLTVLRGRGVRLRLPELELEREV